MADFTKIEWCDASLSLWWGCTKVSEGCKHCYADSLSNRYNRAIWGPGGTRVEVKGWRSTLNKISKRANDEGRRLRVFCQSMSDTFEGLETCGGVESENWDTIVRLRSELFEAIRDHQELDFLLLTKRPEKVNFAIREWLENSSEREGDEILGEGGFPLNLWIGTSVENQETADKRIPELLKIPAKVRFLSCEPLLGPVDLALACFNGADSFGSMPGIHWVICGGESGPKARPMHPSWARSLRDQCQVAEVAFFFKQWGEWAEDDPNGRHVSPHNGYVKPHEDASYAYPADGNFTPMKSRITLEREGFAFMTKVGKKAAGNLLDGQAWSELPDGGM